MQSTDWPNVDQRAKDKIESAYDAIYLYMDTVEVQARHLAISCGRADQALLSAGIGLPALPPPSDDDEDGSFSGK